MKRFLVIIVLIGASISCKNTGENKNNQDDSAVSEIMENKTVEQMETNYVSIDSDEALEPPFIFIMGKVIGTIPKLMKWRARIIGMWCIYLLPRPNPPGFPKIPLVQTILGS